MRFMLEAMSCEALLMTRADAANFLRPGGNLLELPTADPVEAVLAAPQAQRRNGKETAEPVPQARMARRNVLAHFSEDVVAPAHLARVMQAHAAWKKERDRA